MSLGLDTAEERSLLKKDFAIIGVDEVGRGCLAGPVVTAACIITSEKDLEFLSTLGIKDSKKLSQKNRETIFEKLQPFKKNFSISSCSVSVINTRGIVHSVHASARKSVFNLIERYSDKKHYILADNLCTLRSHFTNIQHKSIVKGDDKHISIAAASIVAKVKRDNLMTQLHNDFPKYLWNKNKGYATLIHRSAVKKHGVTSLHRKEFVKNLV